MTNREFFQKYGIYAQFDYDKMLLANSVLIDSILKDRYDEVDTIWCGCVDGNAYKIMIHMNDGTEITAGDANKYRGITIEKDGKKARVEYNPISKNKSSELIDNIEDLTVENVTYTGDLELTEQLQNAIQEQFDTKVREKETGQYEQDGNQEIVNNSTYITSEDIEFLTRQIIVKKLQLVLDNFRSGNNESQPIDIEEFELLTKMLYESVDFGSIGHVSSDNMVKIPDWHTPIPARQYSLIQLPEGKRICAEFLAYENRGTIKIKDIEKMNEPEDDSDFITTKNAIDEQKVIESFGTYNTDETLRQLLERKLHLQNKELSLLESEAKTIDEAEALIDQQKPSQYIGE